MTKKYGKNRGKKHKTKNKKTQEEKGPTKNSSAIVLKRLEPPPLRK